MGRETVPLNSHRQRLIARLLPLVLLVAQLGAVAHAYSHLTTELRGSAPALTQACATCISQLPLLSMAGSPQGALLPDHCTSELVWAAIPAQAVLHSFCPTFRSRAPPFVS